MKKVLLITALSLVAGSFCLAIQKELVAKQEEDEEVYEVVRWWANKMDNEASDDEEKGLYKLSGKQITLNLKKMREHYLSLNGNASNDPGNLALMGFIKKVVCYCGKEELPNGDVVVYDGGISRDGGIMCKLATEIDNFYKGCAMFQIRIEDLDFETSSEEIYHQAKKSTT